MNVLTVSIEKRLLMSKLSSLSADVIPISRNNLLDTIPTLYEEFDVSFELYVNNAPAPNAKRTVIRLTNTNNNKGNYGDRLATVVASGDLTKVFFTSAAEGVNFHVTHTTASLPKSTWIAIRVQQAVIEDRFKLIYWFNGVAVRETLIDLPRVYNDTKVFVGDNFKAALLGTVKNLRISTGRSFLLNLIEGRLEFGVLI